MKLAATEEAFPWKNKHKSIKNNHIKKSIEMNMGYKCKIFIK